MPKFDYDDIVVTVADASAEARPGSKAWVVGIESVRKGPYFDIFPPGIIYTIEFENGDAVDVHESHLQKYERITKE